MSKLKVRNNGRRYTVLDHEIVWVAPTLFGKRIRKDQRGYDTPASIEFPVTAITDITWSEGWFLSSPSMTITCMGGYNDPWRSKKIYKPWKLKFGSDDDDRDRNRALVMAWMLHLAIRQTGRSVLSDPLPARPALMPTRSQEAAAKSAEQTGKFWRWLEALFNKAVDRAGAVRYPDPPADQPRSAKDFAERKRRRGATN